MEFVLKEIKAIEKNMSIDEKFIFSWWKVWKEIFILIMNIQNLLKQVWFLDNPSKCVCVCVCVCVYIDELILKNI